MVDRVISSLIASSNEAADDVLLEALRLGSAAEQMRCVDALLRRKTPTGVFGLMKLFPGLSSALRLEILDRASDELYHLLPEAGRAEDPEVRAGSLRVIAMARLGRLSYVLSENLHHPNGVVAAAAADALVSLARFVASEARRLQSPKLEASERVRACRKLLDMREDIEAAVYRALDLRRPVGAAAVTEEGAGGDEGMVATGGKTQELLRAALLLCDHPASKTLSILSTSRHGGVSPMVRKLQQTPEAEHVDAFLLGATHGQLRQQFAVSFSLIDAPPTLDALLRRTHYLKDLRLELCMRQVNRGAWWTEAHLIKDLARRDADDGAARIGEWIAVSGTHDVVQDEKIIFVLEHVRPSAAARIRLLRIALRRPRGASLSLLRRFLDDPDETIQRIATREIVRRRPADYSTLLLGLMKSGTESVRRVAARAISAGAFDNFFDRFERLDPTTRQRAGRAVFKLLPDAGLRLTRKLAGGTPEVRIRALSVAEELGLADTLRDTILSLVSHEHAKVRSKAVALLGLLSEPAPDLLLDKALQDPDARVRANAIEVLEKHRRQDFVPLLASRARAMSGRERANAIKALHTLRGEAALPQLTLMLQDPRPEHRISALWAARHVGIYRTLTEILRLSQTEADPRVRRYAQASARHIAARVRAAQVGSSAAAASPIPGGPAAGARPPREVTAVRFPRLEPSHRKVI